MRVRIKRVDKNLPLPEYQTPGSVGFDMYSRIDGVIQPGEIGLFPCNLIIETPPGFMLQVSARSSLGRKKGVILPNGVAVVDQDFCGNEDETLIQLWNMGKTPVEIKRGERIVQGVFVKVGIADWEEVEEMASENRGGIGSTDKIELVEA